MMDRREFLVITGGTIVAVAAGTYTFRFLTEQRMDLPVVELQPETTRWGMVIDLTKCHEGCTACLDACRHENNVAWFGDNRWDVHWLRKVTLENTTGAQTSEKSMLLLCNHCDNPPCAQVCPVQATYKRHDGIVIVDHHRCIGCRYCMIACPYNARFFNFKDNEEWPHREHPRRSHGVAESCTLCAHRLDRGQLPACMEACPEGAITVGDLNDPHSEISELIAHSAVRRIREDLGTEPKVYYIGL